MNDSKRDEILIRIDENVNGLKEWRTDIETRTRSLEKSKYTQVGAFAVLVGLWQYLTGGR